jgi:hypothetical protein
MTLFGVNIEQRTTATAKTTAGPSTSLRFAQDDTFWVNVEQRTTATAKTTAGPSTPLRMTLFGMVWRRTITTARSLASFRSG